MTFMSKRHLLLYESGRIAFLSKKLVGAKIAALDPDEKRPSWRQGHGLHKAVALEPKWLCLFVCSCCVVVVLLWWLLLHGLVI